MSNLLFSSTSRYSRDQSRELIFIIVVHFAQGNKRFRDVIALHREDYTRASKTQKPNVSRHIVRVFRTHEPPGRFLKRGDDGHWYDIGDQRAAEKVSQALREKSQEEKSESSDDFLTVQVVIAESLNGHEESQFHPQAYSIPQPDAYQRADAIDNDHRKFLMAGSSSQPVSPITLTHLSSAVDHGLYMEDNIHAI